MNTGIYKIRNKIDDTCYIGSAQVSFYRRKNQHFYLLRHNKHHSIYLQRAWNKYGEDNFIFEIIEECSVEQCLLREQWYLDNILNKYNIQPIAKSRKGTKLTKRQRLVQIKHLNKIRKKLDEPNIRKKMSVFHKGRKKTKEHALAVGAANKKKVLEYSNSGIFIKEWPCIKRC